MLHPADAAFRWQRTENFVSAEGLAADRVTFYHCPTGPWGLVNWLSLRCAVDFLQGLPPITPLHLGVASFVTSSAATVHRICHASAQRLSSARVSQTVISLQLFVSGKHIGVYCQKRTLMLATRKGVLHLNRTCVFQGQAL